MNDDASAATITVGIDLGTLQTKVTLGPTYDHELVRNSHGDHTLPTAITFPGQHRARLIGEDAADVSRADGNTVAMLDRLLVGDKSLNFVFAVPPSYPTCTREALMDAAHAASVSNCAVVDSTEAVTAVYAKKFGDAAAATAGDGGDKKVVLVVEMGHARTSVSLLQLEVNKHTSKVKVLSNTCSSTLGAGIIDICLYHHFLANLPSLSHAQFRTNSRHGQRLLEGCKKLKHLLSMLPEGKITVESIGKNDMDVTLSGNRDLLKQLCEEKVVDELNKLLQSTFEKAGGTEAIGDIAIVELTGGGMRIPMLQDAIHEERKARRQQLLENESAMAQRDVLLLRKDEIRNQIEAHILELRSARHSSKHSSLLPTSEEFTIQLLDGTDDWLFSDLCEEATVEQLEEKWASIQSITQHLCGDFLAAKQADAEQKDREMEAEAKLAAAERDIVMKNKGEANELFSDGNYKFAAARYAKALSHCSKFFDLSPEEEQEVKDVKLSLHINMALAYIKLEKLDNAYQSCNEALKLDETNVKALYRRATVLYQKRKFDEAVKDLKEAEKQAPEDKAVKKLRRLVDQQVARQMSKEKAMAKKMFG
ncbi:heat shock protein-like protein [Thalassiosira pseudonana CCMP1335]|uniref:Heat shock protein-like protein n=1 Tax=Thalassiosira pseudonana TaxID=35128 RepID=B8CGN9_THAPS|nr:heat shock protein-like protein [Thalassiosira pseudonana CCMP1335]EED87358.1 heat shock protein-like protein [Thalassiosira pseudonana CCMP1335]